jgi:hypothetical protein
LRARAPFLAAASATALILLARLFPRPVLLDAATGGAAEGFRLALPASHVLLTPLATLGDLAACSSAWQIPSLAAWTLLAAAALAWGQRRGRPARLLAACGAALGALAWGVLWPRAPARIEAADPELMAVDFHSHTSSSHDGRRWFTPYANLAWHARAGFGAAFVTDHNRDDGAARARALGDAAGAAGFWGEELSLHGAHVLLYGAARAADPGRFVGLDGLERFLRESRRAGSLAVPSLPEYYAHHAQRVEALADWGAAGFEVVAASPRGLAVPQGFRARVVELCRRRGLFLTTGSDNHGYGSTSCASSFLRLPGWRALPAAEREAAALRLLRRGGFEAARVVARARCLEQPESAPRRWLDAPLAAWAAARSWTAAQALLAALWAWAWAAAVQKIRYHGPAE